MFGKPFCLVISKCQNQLVKLQRTTLVPFLLKARKATGIIFETLFLSIFGSTEVKPAGSFRQRFGRWREKVSFWYGGGLIKLHHCQADGRFGSLQDAKTGTNLSQSRVRSRGGRSETTSLVLIFLTCQIHILGFHHSKWPKDLKQITTQENTYIIIQPTLSRLF